MTIHIAIKPSSLAVIIGLVELFVGEVFKLVSDNYVKYARRQRLFRTGRFRIHKISLLNYKELCLTTLLLTVLVALTIALELSIDTAPFKHSKTINTKCFETIRETRLFSGPRPSYADLDDLRLPQYIQQTGCKSLIERSLQGGASLHMGFPKCLKEFENVELDLILGIQGSGFGFVGNSQGGDMHLDYSIVEKGEIVERDILDNAEGNETPNTGLTTSSTWSLGFYTAGPSDSYWGFQRSEERVGSNLAIPKAWTESLRALPKESSGAVNCSINNVECYNMIRPKVLSLSPMVETYEENQLALLIGSLQNQPSLLCILRRLKVVVEWVEINQTIPGVERNGRSGPVARSFQLQGKGECLKEISKQSARMYRDAAGQLDLNLTLPKADIEEAKLMLQRAAIVAGMRLERKFAVDCQVYGIGTGSLIGTGLLAITTIYTAGLVVGIAVMIVLTLRMRAVCEVPVDPLDPLWPVRLLVKEERERRESDEGSNSEDETSGDARMQGEQDRESKEKQGERFADSGNKKEGNGSREVKNHESERNGKNETEEATGNELKEDDAENGNMRNTEEMESVDTGGRNNWMKKMRSAISSGAGSEMESLWVNVHGTSMQAQVSGDTDPSSP